MVIVAEWLVDPLVLVRVMVYVPAVAVTGTVIVTVDCLEVPGVMVSEEGFVLTVHPVGADVVRVIVLLKPLSDVTVAVELPEVPAWMFSVEGEVESEKSAAGVGGDGGGGTVVPRLPKSSV